jgi:hypothetical protein
MPAIRALLIFALASALFVLLACGGGDDSTSTTASKSSTTSTSTETGDTGSGDCDPIEEVDVELGGTHFDHEFTADDYPTNPPTGGDHNPTPIEAGSFYSKPPRLGEAVHLLEHGAVIGWTNDLSAADQQAVEDQFNDVFQDGYYQLAVVENPELDVPFALSAWGAMQKCAQVDPTVIRPFVEQWYASPKTAEGGLACQGDARTLPNC